ncbi:MAG: V-type ATP synthase subunit I [Brevinema sp.]
MAIIKMKKITLAVSAGVKDAVLDELQLVGVAHIDALDTQDVEEDHTPTDLWASDLDIITDESAVLEEQRKEIANAILRIQEFFKKIPPSFEVTSIEKIKSLHLSYDIPSLVETLKELDHTTKESNIRKGILEQELSDVKKWAHTIENFDPIHYKDEYIVGIAGQISEASFENFKQEITLETIYSDVLISHIEDKEVYCYIVASKDVWDKIANIIKNHPFHINQITRRRGDTQTILNNLSQELHDTIKIYQSCLEEWKSYADKIHDLALLHDILEMEIQQKKSASKGLVSEMIYFFRLWIPEHLLPKVLAILSVYEKSIDVTVENPIKEEYDYVPVYLKNNNLTKPFATLTNMYGTPKYGATVDPTPHLSIFYFIYYGICLGDALYGGLLALFSSFMMFKNRSNESLSNLYALLTWSGISAVVAGVLLASYAGDLFTTYIPIPFLTNLSFKFADGSSFFDKPLFVLFVSLLLGGVQLWYGQFLKFIVALRGNKLEACFDNIPWLILLTGFFGWAVFDWIAGLAGLTLLSSEMVGNMFMLMKIGAGLVIVNSMRKGFQKSIVAGLLGPLSGAWELYGISGFLSNLLSYARLLALGLSSGIIANVFNKLVMGIIESLSDITPILGIFGIILLIFLHLFNLVLGGFGAFVHALRLQFVEFFGQFMEGGGKEYQPLQCKGTHYTVR